MARHSSVSDSPNHSGMPGDSSGTLNFLLDSGNMSLPFSSPPTGIQSGSQSMPTNEFVYEYAQGVLQPERFPVACESNLLDRFVEPNQMAVDNTGQNNFTMEDQMLCQNVTMQPQRQHEKIFIKKCPLQVKKMKKVKKENADLKAQYADLKAKNNDLKAENTYLKAENDNLKVENAKLSQQYDGLMSASSNMMIAMDKYMKHKINGSSDHEHK